MEISAKEMNVGADRLAAILDRNAREGRELNIWRQFGTWLLACTLGTCLCCLRDTCTCP